MAEVVYESRVTVVREVGKRRRAELPAGEVVRFGVHGAIAEHYGAPPDGDDVSATLDYLVAAAVG